MPRGTASGSLANLRARAGKGRPKGSKNKITKEHKLLAAQIMRGAIMEKAEVLERLSRQARAEDPWSWKERRLTTPTGEQAEVVEEDYKPGEAASRLLEHYKQLPVTSPTVVVPILAQLPPEVLAETYRKMLASGGNGDGTVTIKRDDE